MHKVCQVLQKIKKCYKSTTYISTLVYTSVFCNIFTVARCYQFVTVVTSLQWQDVTFDNSRHTLCYNLIYCPRDTCSKNKQSVPIA